MQSICRRQYNELNAKMGKLKIGNKNKTKCEIHEIILKQSELNKNNGKINYIK